MQQENLSNVICPICKHKSRFSFTGPHSKVFKCENSDCGHFFANDVNQNQSMYDYTLSKNREIQDEHLINKRRNQLIDFFLKKKIIKPSSKILELGAGLGHFANCFKQQNFEILCIEPDMEGQKILKSQGLSSVSFASDIPPDKVFNFAYLIEVIEHIPNPVEDLNLVLQKLTTDAQIFITTPSSSGLYGRFFKAKSNSFGIPSHIHYFTPKSLVKCLELAGYTSIKRIYTPYCGGPPSRPLWFIIISRLLYAIGLSNGIVILAKKNTK